jgi:cell shape-determining protein MreC
MIIGEFFAKIGVDVSGLDNAEKLKTVIENINSIVNKVAKSVGKFTDGIGEAINDAKPTEALKNTEKTLIGADKALKTKNKSLGDFLGRLNAARVGIIGQCTF